VLCYVALATEMTFSLLIKLLRQASVFLKCIDLPVKPWTPPLWRNDFGVILYVTRLTYLLTHKTTNKTVYN